MYFGIQCALSKTRVTKLAVRKNANQTLYFPRIQLIHAFDLLNPPSGINITPRIRSN